MIKDFTVEPYNVNISMDTYNLFRSSFVRSDIPPVPIVQNRKKSTCEHNGVHSPQNIA